VGAGDLAGEEQDVTRPVPFTTAPEHAVLEAGLFQLSSGVRISRLPLVDSTTVVGDAPGLFARLSQFDATEACKLLGGRLATREEIHELNRVGLRIEPYTMSFDSLMATRPRCEEHDAAVRSMLRAAGWFDRPYAERLPVSNAGKIRIFVPEMNVAIDEAICGWFDERGVPTQNGLGPIKDHRGGGRRRTDYATTTHLVVVGHISMPPVAA
jgi:hypothetical protein